MNADAAPRFVIDPPSLPALPIEGTDALFPVHRVYCVGRNYAAHAVEMGYDPERSPPFFFQKNPDNLNLTGTFPYPPASKDVHHEIELVVALKAGGREIPVADANACVYGYAVGLDMTRRDLQAKAKELGRPWEVAKAFEASGPCSPLVPVSQTGILELRGDLARRQRRTPPDRRHQPDGLEGARDDRLPVAAVHPDAG